MRETEVGSRNLNIGSMAALSMRPGRPHPWSLPGSGFVLFRGNASRATTLYAL